MSTSNCNGIITKKIWTLLTRLTICISLGMTASALTSGSAHADYEFCNKTSYVLKTAIGHKRGNAWKSRGWWILYPGQCESVIEGALDQSTYYTFARSVYAHAGGIKYFAGSHRFCVNENEFQVDGRGDCDRRGHVERRFAQIKVGSARSWTTSFTEPNDFDLEEARIAGVQRLLKDVGKKSRIDGLMGRKTRRAIISSKRKYGLAANDQLTNDLFAKLVSEASSIQQDTGYNLCNETSHQIWAAIGYEAQKELVTTGWFKLDPGKCTKAIKDKLRAKVYYTYAEAEIGRKKISWGGDHFLCTMDNRFTINGRSDCEKRGFMNTGFLKVETGAKAGWTQTFSEQN